MNKLNLLSLALILSLTACGDDDKAAASKEMDKMEESTTAVMESTTKAVTETTEAVAEEAVEAVEESAEETDDLIHRPNQQCNY